MIELLKHIFGLCGDGHPTIWMYLGSIGVVYYVLKHNIIWCWKKGCNFCLEKYNSIIKK